VYFLLKEFN